MTNEWQIKKTTKIEIEIEIEIEINKRFIPVKD